MGNLPVDAKTDIKLLYLKMIIMIMTMTSLMITIKMTIRINGGTEIPA